MGEEAAAVPPAVAAVASAPPHLLLRATVSRPRTSSATRDLLLRGQRGRAAGGYAGVSAGGGSVPMGRGHVLFEFLEDGDPGPDLHNLMRHLETAGPPAFAALLGARRRRTSTWW
ncbi:limonoid UDP-glucosyltransferase [Panicum miliaceum]|uniref:Limonoid UDP-glucosyltransferase n=1 Tax=Panicum miliaceum TaxID=4540 RepID=A0A3L6RKI6_PANMI|nr:limonoid UDP-glucosyltransferase [Panicum miliaceum]